MQNHAQPSAKDVHMMKCHGYFRKLTLEKVFRLDQTSRNTDSRMDEQQNATDILASVPVLRMERKMEAKKLSQVRARMPWVSIIRSQLHLRQ